MLSENVNKRESDSGVGPDNPWPGLISFAESDHEYFHGRLDEGEDLFRRVVRRNLTVLFGQSGLGKSSLLKASLFPCLRNEGYLPVPIRLDHSPSAVSLSQQVVAAVERAMRQAGAQCDTSTAEYCDSLWQFFHCRKFNPETADGEPLRLVMVFDQFEELFATGQANEHSRARASEFVNEFADLIENRVPLSLEQEMEENPDLTKQFDLHDQEHRFLICLREDYLPQLESLHKVIPSLSENRMRLNRMNGDNALQAVVNPGTHIISTEVGIQVVRFVSGGKIRQLDGTQAESGDGLADLEVESSLLSLVCRELNNRRKAMSLDHISADLLAGSQDRILQDFYEECVADQPPAVREFIEEELVTDSGLRENIALERVQKALKQHDIPVTVIDELVSRRLLHVEERLDVQRVELTHDVLTSVIKKSRDERHSREATIRAEEDAASVRAVSRSQRRRLSIVVGGMAIVLAIVSAFGVASYRLYRLSENRLTEVERQKERAAAGEAEALTAKKGAEAVKEVFDAATVPVTEEVIDHLPGLGPVEMELARLRIESLHVLAKKTPNDSSILPKLAQAYLLSGVIRTFVGSFQDAKEDLNKSGKLYADLAEQDPNSLEYRLAGIRVSIHLGYLHWDDNRKPAARKFYSGAFEKLETELKRSPEEAAIQLEMARVLVRIGGVQRGDATKEEKRAISQRAIELSKGLISSNYRVGESKRLLAVATYRIRALHFDEVSVEQRLANMDEVAALDQAAREHFPESPCLQSYNYFWRNDRADALMTVRRFEEALKERELAVSEVREIVRRSPNTYRYADLLAESLKNLGNAYRRNGRFKDATEAFEESKRLSDANIGRFTDRGFAASQWLRYRNQIADSLEHGGATHPDGPIKAKELLLVTLDKTIKKGRELADRFSNHYYTQMNFSEILSRRGRFEKNAKRYKSAYPYFREAVDVYYDRMLADESNDVDSYALNTFMNYVAEAVHCAKENGDRVALRELVMQAQAKRHQGITRVGWRDLGRVFHSAGQFHEKKSEYHQAITLHRSALDVRLKAYAEAPWDYYLEENISGSHWNLANCYHEEGDFSQEIIALREYLKMQVGPNWGVEIAPYLDQSREPDMAEAKRIRDFIENATKDGTKRFTITCDFAGVKQPFGLYITNVKYPTHPLAKQARWLKEERGGIIPQDVMDSFARLHKIAHENNVSFVDLCVYALGTAAAEEKVANDGSRRELDPVTQNTVEDVKAVDSSHDVFATAQLQLIETRQALEKNPNSVALMDKAAAQYEQLGSNMLKAGQVSASINVIAEAIVLRQQLLAQFPNNPTRTKAFADSLRLLGTAYFRQNDLDNALSHIRRHSDLLHRLERIDPKSEAKLAIAQCSVIFGEIAEIRGATVEAMDWYQVAATQKNPRAYRKIAHLLGTASNLKSLLTDEDQQVFESCVKVNKVGTIEFVDAFHDQMTLAHMGSLERYKAQMLRGMTAFRESRFADSLPYFVSACESEHVTPENINRLGMCYGKLERWDEAIVAYTRCINMDAIASEAEGHVLNTLEALIIAERPSEFHQVLAISEKKDWTELSGASKKRFDVLRHAFTALILLLEGKDSAAEQAAYRKIMIEGEGYKVTGWGWTELDLWLKENKLQPDQKEIAEGIVNELKGNIQSQK